MAPPYHFYTEDRIVYEVVETLFVRADKLTNANVRSMYWGSTRALAVEAATRVLNNRGYRSENFFEFFKWNEPVITMNHTTSLYMLLVKCFLRYFAKEIASLKSINPLRYARLTRLGHPQIHNDLMRTFKLGVFPRILDMFEEKMGESDVSMEDCMNIELPPEISTYIYFLTHSCGKFNDSSAYKKLHPIIQQQLHCEILFEAHFDQANTLPPQPNVGTGNRVYGEIKWEKDDVKGKWYEDEDIFDSEPESE